MTSARQLSLFILCATVALFAACSNDKVKMSGTGGLGPGANSKVDKDAEPLPSISSVNDLFALTLTELSWNRRSYALSKNPPSVPMKDGKDGCISHTPQRGNRFLHTNFQCTRTGDSSDSSTDRTYLTTGMFNYTLSGTSFTVNGLLNRQITSISKSKVIAYGVFDRVLHFTPLTSDAYRSLTRTTFAGQTAAGSTRVGETFSIDTDAAFVTNLKLNNGAVLTTTYTPEHSVLEPGKTDRPARYTSYVLTLKASTDIAFDASDVCARPLGAFTWTLDQITTLSDGTSSKSTTTGSLGVTAAGLTNSSETVTRPWGARCLEN